MRQIFTIDNLPWIITTCIAIIAFISPIVTTVINNHHQIKLKQLEYDFELRKYNNDYQISALQDYLSVTSRVIINSNEIVDLSDYSSKYSIAITIIDDDELLSLMKKLNSKLIYGNTDGTYTLYEEILPKVKKCIKRIQN